MTIIINYLNLRYLYQHTITNNVKMPTTISIKYNLLTIFKKCT